MRFLNKRTFLLLIAIVLATILFDRYRLYRKTYEELSVVFKDQKIEYGSDLTAMDLIKESHGELTIDQEIDPYTVGEQKLAATVKAESPRYHQSVSRTYDHTYEIVDTQAPIIEFKKDTIVKYAGTDYDPKENIERVYDIVDGDIADYTISGNYDLQNKGIYDVTVTATDKNGLIAEASYCLTIKSKVIMNTGEAYQYIYDRLTGDYGFSKAAACGILANMSYESSFNPTVGDYYYGLIQWGGGRRDSLVSWCAANGYEYDTIDGQLAFMYHELTGGYRATYDFLMSVPDTAQGAYDAGEYFCRYYEVAASVSARPDLAAAYFNGE
ncbi:MAG: hypothetical protein IKS51_00465 [Erysipelotrichaceae bacterium]|nr:hypothetical protein [Erysipelotrichaceae bacterium]